MLNNTSLKRTPVELQIPSTQGMTTKVVKGSIWTMGGQVVPLLVSFFATPFVIRLLGAESYGVYILIGLIPTYFSFADFGMNIGSTKFGSEAYARGAREDEGKIVRTAALIAFLTSFLISICIFLLSYKIIALLNVPEHLHKEASISLKITSITFVLNVLCNVFNTPQLSRLRMDLNTFINSGFRLFGIVIVPIILYLGGGIIGAISTLMVASLLTLLGHLFVSGKLLSELFQFSIDRSIVKPLLKFGSSLVVAGIAAVLLVNLEKIVLARVTSVETLAYYSVAFTLAYMTTMFSSSMIQSLMPAFSQLVQPSKTEELNQLFNRSLRLNFLLLVPGITFLFVIAKPFFTIWAGEQFGRESTMPFYILLVGLFFNIPAYVPHTILLSSGRADLIAKLYWVELFPYILLVAMLTSGYGAIGAALAWSLRVTVDAFLLIWLAKKTAKVSYAFFRVEKVSLMLMVLICVPPVLCETLFSVPLIFLTIICFITGTSYCLLTWRLFLLKEEKLWIMNKMRFPAN